MGLLVTGRNDEAGRVWWAGPDATFFQRATVSRRRRADGGARCRATPQGVTVRIRVDGREQPPVVLPYGSDWQTIRLRPATDAWRTSRYWRIDLEVTPVGVPDGTPAAERRIAGAAYPRSVPAWEPIMPGMTTLRARHPEKAATATRPNDRRPWIARSR